MDTATNLWLDPIPRNLRQNALTAFEDGDAIGFLICAGNDWGLEMVFRNFEALHKRGIYEEALLTAYTGCRMNWSQYSAANLRLLFTIADHNKLRQAGSPLPGSGPFTAYRGVSGIGSKRRVRGFSWTASEQKARWFAERLSSDLGNPGVYRADFYESEVLAYSNEREEQEFIIMPDKLRPKLIWKGPSDKDEI